VRNLSPSDRALMRSAWAEVARATRPARRNPETRATCKTLYERPEEMTGAISGLVWLEGHHSTAPKEFRWMS
jgi:hypothetical protein